MCFVYLHAGNGDLIVFHLGVIDSSLFYPYIPHLPALAPLQLLRLAAETAPVFFNLEIVIAAHSLLHSFSKVY